MGVAALLIAMFSIPQAIKIDFAILFSCSVTHNLFIFVYQWPNY